MKISRDQRNQIKENVACIRRQKRKARGELTAYIRSVADELELAEGYVWQIAREGARQVRRRAWQLTDLAIELYYRKLGTITDVHAELVKRDPTCPGIRQLQRAFTTQMDSDELAFVKGGAAKRRSRSGCIRWEARHRNAIWQTDHVQLGVPVWINGRKKKLWLTYFIDCYSRMVMGWMVSVRQSSDAVLEALRDGITIDLESGKPHGGKPKVIMYDNSLTFLAKVVGEAAALLDFGRQAIEPYMPHRNGKVERCHQTISRIALRELPMWDKGPRDKKGWFFSNRTVSEERLLVELRKAIHYYNFDRPHSSLGGRTPWEAFAGDRTPLRVESRERLRFALKHRKVHTVQTSGVYKHKKYYQATNGELATLVGHKVIVAWLRKDKRSVDVYDLNENFICEAVPHEALTEDQKKQHSRREHNRHKRQDKKLREVMRAAEELYAPTNEPGGLRVVSDLPALGPEAQEALELVGQLGLADQVGKKWTPKRELERV